MKHHVEHEVAILLVCNLSIDRVKHCLCFLEQVPTLCPITDLRQRHCIRLNCLVRDKCLFTIDPGRHLHSLLCQIDDLFVLLV